LTSIVAPETYPPASEQVSITRGAPPGVPAALEPGYTARVAGREAGVSAPPGDPAISVGLAAGLLLVPCEWAGGLPFRRTYVQPGPERPATREIR
jgi:hypothetical protein